MDGFKSLLGLSIFFKMNEIVPYVLIALVIKMTMTSFDETLAVFV